MDRILLAGLRKKRNEKEEMNILYLSALHSAHNYIVLNANRVEPSRLSLARPIHSFRDHRESFTWPGFIIISSSLDFAAVVVVVVVSKNFSLLLLAPRVTCWPETKQ